MSEIKTEIKQNPDGNYTITDAHSTADVVRWLLTQDSKETILYLLGDTPQRTWVGLTNDEINNLAAGCHLGNSVQDAIYKAVVKIKEKNNG